MYNEHDYWDARYISGRSSGAGSYGEEAKVKVTHINSAIEELGVKSVLDLGCGDGNIILQIAQANPQVEFTAIDISECAIELDRAKAKKQKLNNVWFMVRDVASPDIAVSLVAECVLCLDVLFHIKNNDSYRNILTNIKDIYSKVAIISTWNKAFMNPTTPIQLKEYEYYRGFRRYMGIKNLFVEIPLPSKIKSLFIYRKGIV